MKRLLVVLAAGLALGACTLAPAYQRPAAPVPAAWPTGAAYPAASSAASISSWHDVVLDPKLKAVVELALANNRDLRIAAANIVSARSQYRIQRADLFPSIVANFGASYAGEPVAAFSGGIGTGTVNEHLYQAGAGFTSYELDLFGRIRSLTTAAQEQYFATEEARKTAQISLVAEVASDWLTLAADTDLLAVARDTLEADRSSLDLTQHRFDAGVASMVDVSQAKTSFEQARSDVASFTTQVAQDRNALNLVVGAQTRDDLLPAGLGDQLPVAETTAGVSSDVLLGRPDVMGAEDQLKGQNANIGAARAAFLPRIALTGQGGAISPALQTLFTGASQAWSFAPNLALPIFQGGRNIAGLDQAKAQRDAALATYEKAIQTAFREVADALARRGTIDEQLDAQSAQAAAAEQNLFLTNARYQHGTASSLDVLIAQRTAYTARQTLVAAKLARANNLVTLYKTLGGGWR